MTSFKLYALLMCKGNLRKKAETFYEIASGTLDENEAEEGAGLIAFNSGRLTRAFK